MILHEEGMVSLIADCIRQAVEDYEADFHKSGIPDAGAFLLSAGLLDDDGRLDPRFRRTRRHSLAQGRPRTAGNPMRSPDGRKPHAV
jgi:hypothetical protein